MIQERIFRAYDIRGIYRTDLDEEVALMIGKATSAYLDGEMKEITVGMDVRLSSKALEDALIEGLLSGGCNVEEIGLVTTPILYFSSAHYKKDAGIMITASHNPPEWNGFKIWTKGGFICEGMGMEKLKKIVMEKSFRESRTGKLRKNPRALIDYEDYVLKNVKIKRGLKGVFDPGNGACSVLIPKLYEDAGIRVIALNSEPDGRFPNHPPEATEEVLNELAKVVLKEKADFGVCFDGDGDRCVFVDDKGRIVPSDSILILLAEQYLKEYKGAPIVYEVSCSMSVEGAIRLYGGKPILSRVGHAYIYENMLNNEAVFGGESSGHFYFAELHGFDDALFACLKLIEVLSRRSEKFSDVIDSIPIYPRFSKNFDCPDEKKFKVVDSLKDEFVKAGRQVIAIDGVKVIDSGGWFLIRPSNTQPQIRVIVEAETRECLKRLTEFAERKLLEKIQF
ncbi:MAG: phosphomannomutase/phosphoglucomutase [Candidatus Bathyarchaeia archaeon]